MKGIILAGGSGTRLYPLTKVTSKQLLPVYDKPMVYYPLSLLMQADVRDILLISTPADLPRFRWLFGDGSSFGLRMSYAEQPSPDGLAQAFIIAEAFIGDDCACMVLGDNLFDGPAMDGLLQSAVRRAEQEQTATIVGIRVPHPERFGIMSFDADGRITGIEEKPKQPKSDVCVTGVYFYDNRVVRWAKELTPSARGELEITDLNNRYLQSGALHAELLDERYTWMDAGTHESLAAASAFVQQTEKRRGCKLGCLEEIAWRKGWIGRADVEAAIRDMKGSSYGAYLQRLLDTEGEGLA